MAAVQERIARGAASGRDASDQPRESSEGRPTTGASAPTSGQ
jgi:hypothetical protein